ncbi:MAG: DUF47 family protein [Deltaproteobacteria bacterium]|nr:DUF47 family protein [Deltaproteobacteria bacterium]MBW2219186.1 DUF47 family protein [Deltaproteobacteria bacterium]
MKIPILYLFTTSPFDSLIEHSEKVKECTWAFQQAIECHVSERCETFEGHRQEVAKFKNEADIIKELICSDISARAILPVNKFQLLMYLKAQNNIIDAVVGSLNWLSHRDDPGIPKELKKEVFLLVDAVIEPIEELSSMLAEAKTYFRKFSRKKRAHVKNIIINICQKKHEADKAEDILKHRVFSLCLDSVIVFHMVRLSEIIGAVADHAENAGDIMRAMIAR